MQNASEFIITLHFRANEWWCVLPNPLSNNLSEFSRKRRRREEEEGGSVKRRVGVKRGSRKKEINLMLLWKQTF
jgi:hypothetical protein